MLEKCCKQLSFALISFIFITFLFFSFLGFAQEAGLMAENSRQLTPIDKTASRKKLVKILSIDGGGIRGVIPALILKEIESKLKKKKHLSQCFDVMAGTSTGGIIVLMLNTPDMEGKPKYTSQDIVSIYRNISSAIFHQSWWRFFTSFNGWLGEKYSSDNLDKYMRKYFGDTRLRDALTNIIIPAYEISEDDTVFFKSNKAQLDIARDFYFRDIARSTSAAPTYFKPAQIKDLNYHKVYTLIDGGVAVNNPTMSACVHALKIFGRDNDFVVVSIGAGTNYGVPVGRLSYHGREIKSGGKIDWASDIVSMLMYASSDVVDYQMAEIFISDNGEKKYYRFQALLEPKHTDLDDVSPENIKALEEYAQDLINTHQADLAEVAAILDGD